MFLKLYNQTRQKKPPFRISSKLPQVTNTIYEKSYPRFSRFLLPSVSPLTVSLGDALVERQSFRSKIGKGMPDIKKLSHLLFYSCGIKSLPNKKIPFSSRTYPSGGARYPLEIYLYLRKPIYPLTPAIYHYQVQMHALETLPITNSDRILKKEILGQVNSYWLKDCWGLIFISAVYQRSEIKYGRASFRYVLLEAGHVMQNIYLVSTALQLGCCALGGFVDKKINTFLNLDIQKEVIVYCANLVA